MMKYLVSIRKKTRERNGSNTGRCKDIRNGVNNSVNMINK